MRSVYPDEPGQSIAQEDYIVASLRCMLISFARGQAEIIIGDHSLQTLRPWCIALHRIIATYLGILLPCPSPSASPPSTRPLVHSVCSTLQPSEHCISGWGQELQVLPAVSPPVSPLLLRLLTFLSSVLHHRDDPRKTDDCHPWITSNPQPASSENDRKSAVGAQVPEYLRGAKSS